MSDWKRPASVPFPSIWRKFEGKQIINGKKRQYWIQDLTDDLRNEAIEHMCSGFVKDEAICKYNKYIEDPMVIEDCRNLWKHTTEQKLGLVCLTKHENGENEIVGMNMTYRSYKNEPEDSSWVKTKNCKVLLDLMKYIYGIIDAYEYLKIDHQMTAVGLYVPPKYRGEGIGVELLKSREDICRAVGIPATLTLFTSRTSQAVAKKAGFTDLVDVTHDELEKVNPDFTPPGIRETALSMKYMYIVYK